MNPFRFRPHKYLQAPKAARTVDGFTFDSKVEMDYYLYLTSLLRAIYGPRIASQLGIDYPQVLHVDVHPKVTLGPGDRVEPDFLVWYADGRVEFIDCKGSHPDPKRLAEFRRLQRRWRHPAGPLVGIVQVRGGRGWTRLEPP